MYNKKSKFFSGLLILIFSGSVFAQGKRAVVDFEEAMLSSEYAIARLEALQKNENYKNLNTEYNLLKSDLQALQKDAESNGKNWNEEKRREVQERAQYLSADFELATKKLNAKKKQVFKEIIQAIQDKAKKALSELVESEKVGMLLDRQVALIASPEYDLTNKLIVKINEK